MSLYTHTNTDYRTVPLIDKTQTLNTDNRTTLLIYKRALVINVYTQ